MLRTWKLIVLTETRSAPAAVVIMSFDEQLEEARFVRRQLIVGAFGQPNLAKQRDDASRDFRRHRRAPVNRFSQSIQQSRGWRLLQKITTGARARRVENPFVVVTHRVFSTRTFGCRFFRILTPSIPLMPGSPISDSTTSGSRCGIFSSASSIVRKLPVQENGARRGTPGCPVRPR